jgi:catechol 2,3-dioxygenase-like lactoylglutathione lyase family enzyme
VPELNHLALAVRDPRRSLHFYSNTIGVEGAVREEEYGFVLTTPKGVVFTLFKGSPPTDNGEFHIGVSLPDGDAVRAQLGSAAKLWSTRARVVGRARVRIRQGAGS